MQNEKYWSSRIPVVYALLFVLNAAIVVLIEVLFLYTLPQELTPEDLAEKNPAYEGCVFLASESSNEMTCYLVKTQSGETHLVTTQRHRVLFMRSRLLKSQTAIIPEESRITVNVKIGIHTVPVTVENASFSESFHFNGGDSKAVTTWYLVLGAVLEALELMAYHFIRKNL